MVADPGFAISTDLPEENTHRKESDPHVHTRQPHH